MTLLLYRRCWLHDLMWAMLNAWLCVSHADCMTMNVSDLCRGNSTPHITDETNWMKQKERNLTFCCCIKRKKGTWLLKILVLLSFVFLNLLLQDLAECYDITSTPINTHTQIERYSSLRSNSASTTKTITRGETIHSNLLDFIVMK